MAWLSNTEHIWRYWGESYDLPGDRLPTPGKSAYRTCGFEFVSRQNDPFFSNDATPVGLLRLTHVPDGYIHAGVNSPHY
jgi:hypothetical protein